MLEGYRQQTGTRALSLRVTKTGKRSLWWGCGVVQVGKFKHVVEDGF